MRVVSVLVASSFLLVGVAGTAQGQQEKQQQVPQKQRPVQQPVRRPAPQIVRPMQVRPGQISQPGRPGIAPQRRVAKPGVVRGAAGAFRKVRPANVAFNPRHKIGSAGRHFNRQAFLFKRGNHFYRRAYYLGPGGEAFFYDEAIDGDPSLAEVNVSSLATCPEDSDDCQGLAEDQSSDQPLDPRAEALQYLMSIRPDITWLEDGLELTGDDDDVLMTAYNMFKIKVTSKLSAALGFGIGGGEPDVLRLETKGLFGGRGWNVLEGPMAQNQDKYERTIKALNTLGVEGPAR